MMPLSGGHRPLSRRPPALSCTPKHKNDSRIAPGAVFVLSGAQQRLVKGKQGLVDFKDVVSAVGDEILDDDVELVAVGEGEARLHQQLPGLRQGQLQGDGKGDGRGLGWAVARIGADLGEELSIHVCPLVAGGVRHALLVDLPQQHLGKALVQTAEPLIQLRGPGRLGVSARGVEQRFLLRRSRRRGLGGDCRLGALPGVLFLSRKGEQTLFPLLCGGRSLGSGGLCRGVGRTGRRWAGLGGHGVQRPLPSRLPGTIRFRQPDKNKIKI